MTSAKRKTLFLETVEYLAAVASIAAILGVLYFTWPIRQDPDLQKEVKTPIVKLNLAGMRQIYDLRVSTPKFYKRHDHADAFFKKWRGMKAVLFPLGKMDSTEFARPGRFPEDIDWESELLEQAITQMSVRRNAHPKFDSTLDMTTRLPYEEIHDVDFNAAQNIMESISKEFANKRLAPFVDAYSRNRKIFTPVVVKNDSDVDTRNIVISVNNALYPGADFLTINGNGPEGKVALLPAHQSTWLFIRTWNAPVEASDIVIAQEGERIRGKLLITILAGSAFLLLVARIVSHG